jgi:hypothetical protein
MPASSTSSVSARSAVGGPARLMAGLAGGMLALGSLDLLFAWSYWHPRAGTSLLRVLQSIASGLLGGAAFQGGVSAALLGALLHYLIMLAMVGAYGLASARLPRLRRRPWLYGGLYGLVLYAVMNGVVRPLSAMPSSGRPEPVSWIAACVALHLVIGVSIAWINRWARRGDRSHARLASAPYP